MGRRHDIHLKIVPPTYNYCVGVPTPSGRKRWVSTGETNLFMARKIVQETGVDRLVALANAGALTQSAMDIITGGNNLTWETILPEWRARLLLARGSSTVDCYEQWLRVYTERNRCISEPITHTKIDALDEFVNEDGLKLSTKNQRLAALRSFYKFAVAMGHTHANLPDALVVRSRDMTVGDLTTRKTAPFTDGEVDRMLNCGILPPAWKYGVIIGYWTGLRMIDIFCLEWESIGETSIRVFMKKTQHWVNLPLDHPDIGSPQLLATIRELQAQPKKHPVYVFPIMRDRRRESDADLSIEFYRLLRRIGIEGKSFHSLRYSFSHRLLKAGWTLEQIGTLTGHVELAITAKYAGAPPPPETRFRRRSA